MKSGAPAFGTPEYMKAQLVGGQLARRYSLPYRTSNTCAANTVDAQAAYESVFSLWGAIQGGANFMLHGAGWLEGGLRCSYEKTILDIDLLQMVAEFLTPLDLSDDALGVDAIRVGRPRRPFLRHASTRRPATRPPSIRRSSPTGATSRPGPRPARRPRSRGQPRLEGAPRDLRGAVHGPGDPRGARRLRRQAPGRRRRPDGFLRLRLQSRLRRCDDDDPLSVSAVASTPLPRIDGGEDAPAASLAPFLSPTKGGEVSRRSRDGEGERFDANRVAAESLALRNERERCAGWKTGRRRCFG